MIDQATIKVRGGNGGRGTVSFRREKFVRLGGPDGGAGGKGGDVYLCAVDSRQGLGHLVGRASLRAEAGASGAGANRYGKAGDDLEIEVPPGTEAKFRTGETEETIDLMEAGSRVLVAKGGIGGRGNKSFVTSWMQVPRIAEAGEAGQSRTLWLDYKILAAVAILGLPNSGKSTLLNNLAGIETKVAEYPLTTVEPVVGVVEKRWRQYRLVEIPATWWKRGDDKQRARDSVLKHSERAKVLLICIDSCSESPVEDYASIDGAIRRHGRGLPEKPRIIVVTKVDLSPEASALKGMAESFMPSPHSWHMISCITGQGLEELLKAALDLVEGSSSVEAPQSEARLVTFKPKPRREKAVVEKRGGLFVVRSDQVERLVAGTDLNDWEARAQLAAYMEKVGVQRALEKAGVKRGDTVRIGRTELEWQ